ncbi:MAG: polysaccharide pyruvyl transferase family protein [Nitrososphaerota archaeon]|nr:polysaccharide pyruvyl transferase family protein [Nitrososphaerota archaeon]
MVSPTIRPNELFEKCKVLQLSPLLSIRSVIGEVINYVMAFGVEERKKVLFELFRNHHLKRTKTAKNLDELRKIAAEFDAVIVGSDQIWNPEFLKYSDFSYLLPFILGKVRKIAFSASLGVDDVSLISQRMVKIYELCLKDFNFISLRERCHINFLSRITGKKIYHTIDPTLLVDIESYNSLCATSFKIPFNRYIFAYNLDPSILPLADELSKELGLPLVIYRKPRIFPLHERLYHSKRLNRKMSVEYVDPCRFLNVFKNADFIITNSYHGTILSIIFEKPFVTVACGIASKTVSRITDLLELLGLDQRIIVHRNELRDSLRREINFKDVKNKLNKYRKISLNLLESALYW